MCVGILFGPADLEMLRDEIIDLISFSLHSSKTNLWDFVPLYLRFFKISSAIDVK